MKYVRVNFLKKNERRYQGPVSQRVLMAAIITVPIVIVALIAGIRTVQYSHLQTQLEDARKKWEQVEPQYAAYQKEMKNLGAARKGLELLDAWQTNQVPLSVLLDEIQRAIPATIQLRTLLVHGSSRQTLFSKPEELEMEYSMEMTGVSLGEEADTDVITLTRVLGENEFLKKMFGVVKLASMRRRTIEGNENACEFIIKGLVSEDDE